MTLEDSTEMLDLQATKQVLEELQTFRKTTAYAMLVADIKTAQEVFFARSLGEPEDYVEILARERALASSGLLLKHSLIFNDFEELLVAKLEQQT